MGPPLNHNFQFLHHDAMLAYGGAWGAMAGAPPLVTLIVKWPSCKQADATVLWVCDIRMFEWFWESH